MANGEEMVFLDNLLAHLFVGKQVSIELKRYLFTAQNYYAIVLCDAFIDGLSVLVAHTLCSGEISDCTYRINIELRRLSNVFEERLENVPDEGYRFLSRPKRYNGRGRPMFFIPESQVVGLLVLNFSRKEIAAMLGVSTKTLSRRRAESDKSICANSHTSITDEQLDRTVAGILANSPNSGKELLLENYYPKMYTYKEVEFV